MGGLADSEGKSPFRLRHFLLICGILVLTVSCKMEPVLVVSDPYLEAVQGEKWILHRPWFRLRALARGFRILPEKGSIERPLPLILQENSNYEGIVVVSPFMAHITGPLQYSPKRLIVAGGTTPPERFLKWEAVTPDLTEAVEAAGKLAAGYVSRAEHKKALVIKKAASGVSEEIIQQFERSFREHGGNEVLLDQVYWESSSAAELPENVRKKISSSDLLILLSGGINIMALDTDTGRGIPVIGRFTGIPELWPENVMASVEDDASAMSRALMNQLKDPELTPVRLYSARLKVIKSPKAKKWFDAIFRQTYNSARR